MGRKKVKKERLIEQVYGKMGPFYNFVYGKLLFHEGREAAIELLNPKKGSQLLEVGVGTGLSLPLYPHDCHVTGIDYSQSMLDVCRKLVKKRRIDNVDLKLMNANKLVFEDNSFDGVIAFFVISATSKPRQAIREMKRVCKPGGTLVIMNHFRSENKVMGKMEDWFKPVGSYLGFDSALDMDSLLDDVGLEVRALRKVNFGNMWTAVSLVNPEKNED